jgi:phosphatidylserine/phosphatidylglycerophosphate/cardiolipin synthase-like enzyme
MPWLKKQLPVFILFLFVYTAYFFTHIPVTPKTSHVLSADTQVTLFTQPDSGEAPVVSILDKAQKEILMVVYLLSDKQVIASLEQAQARGVHVVVMLEQHPFGGGNLNQKTAEELKSKQVEVGWASPDFSLTHQKSIIVDQTYLFILNQNLTTAAFSKNREYNILDTNPTDIQEVRNMFIADWQRKPFTPSQTHLIISPKSSRDGITQLIQNTQKSLDIEVEIISDESIINELLSLATTRQIRLITPTFSQISSNEEAVRKLAAGGVLVRLLSSPYVHAKLILSDQKAYIGSVNLSSQSMDENRELGIMIEQPEIIQTLRTDFETDWAKGKTL